MLSFKQRGVDLKPPCLASIWCAMSEADELHVLRGGVLFPSTEKMLATHKGTTKRTLRQMQLIALKKVT
ncbi:hypothetical protein KIN20_034535 [Parelaphostrongylus tenuis]|uniref:Uncharacterized protein n=1 Tax=Parelaphostrongylus tenuis TaxID=148309 RepID=A0AAD5RCQ5_PARTN|nr:hypothetical protein KIN20_034535 [Parelaphostrongylus tenuis]